MTEIKEKYGNDTLTELVEARKNILIRRLENLGEFLALLSEQDNTKDMQGVVRDTINWIKERKWKKY